MVRIIALLCACAVEAAASGMTAAINSTDVSQRRDIGVEAEKLKEAAEGGRVSPPAVYDMAHGFFAGVPGAKIAVSVDARRWDREPAPPRDPATPERLLDSAAKRVSEQEKGTPLTASQLAQIKESLERLKDLKGQDKLEFDQKGEMNEGQMGRYGYKIGSAERGWVQLHRFLAPLTQILGDAIVFCTPVHEARHDEDHQAGRLSPKAVIAGEILAFKAQYLWLRFIDPHGERLPRLRAELRYDVEVLKDKSRLKRLALEFADHCAQVVATGGDERKLKELVERLGYRDGQADRPSSAPAA